MIGKYASAVLLPCLFVGCVDLRVESRDDIPTSRTRYETCSVVADEFSGICPQLVRTGTTQGRFSLECKGKYRLTRLRKTEGERMGKYMLSIGLFPGLYWMSDCYDGTNYAEWPLDSLTVLLANGVMAGVPTLLSLFYEPFDSHHDAKCGIWSSLAGYGIMGCCKRIRQRAWAEPIQEQCLETVVLQGYTLSDYTILLLGLPYHCEKGKKSVSVTVPSGKESMSVQIRSVPKMEGELGRFVDSLSGTEFEVGVQSPEAK